ncbi:hypothetical protein FVEN_g6553 [Fusarium venenatum]|uniref:Nuclear GTPase SLIP-GC n=1 Tax=Fusarium venenatum TaxID=56646 RepID=A0A2L2ST45_9HYPO|nr:uncharacterized protein FVRRES_04848 [Fusarium venenatum]KAG8355754.1 hypothetical protein FVEN_g6553 [Fusarium venenatum]KAH6991984.1 hypothetical protein EDB82DRAFT_535139 [Fusarium venenatum]CEI60412.1 unnamed protein product [Fusarium venenatum]
MEVGDGAAPTVPVKRERSPSSERTPDVPSVKRQADETTGVARAPVKFPWRECQDLDDVKRLKIKEKAVKQAKENCNKIRALLEPAIATVDANPDSTDAVIIGRKIIQQWLDQDNTTHEALKKHQVLVGVEGPTGAGKSSFLGSLLRIPELLPSGQESAATAVIGKVSWNSNDTPGHEFRAEITFRPKEEVQNDLASLLQELNRYKDLMANKFREEDDDAQDKADAVIESRNKIEYELPKIKAVWGIEKEHLEKAVVSCPEYRSYADVALGILKKNNHVLKLLDQGCVESHQSTAKKLGKIIKPYLDSSVMKVGDRVEFALWPLVKDVHIFTKAEILKSGITLVDLPGCGDATASRSEVAQKISSDLDVRMIVSPIIRATDEKQGQTLMQSGFDEAQMRIRGKLDGNGFGVIVSKIDGINFESYIDGCDELWGDEEIAQKRERLALLKDQLVGLSRKSTTLRNNKARAENAKKLAQKNRKAALDRQKLKPSANPGQDAERLATAQAAVDKRVQAYDDADKALDEHHEESRRVEQEQTYLKDWLNHRASQTRNKRVMKRMRENFAIRQREFGDESISQKSQVEGEYVLPIYPISTTAFWQLEKGDRRLDGFPSQRFTGIPAVEQWLHRATLSKREKHLDEILDGYQSQLAMMRIYSQTSGKDGNFNFTRGEVEQAVAHTHSVFVEKLGATLKGAAMEIEKLDPLEHRTKAVNKFVGEAKKIALRWIYKFPDDKQSPLKISANTYYANIRRSGGKFQSHYTPRVTYNWMENLAAPVLKIIGKDWDSKMNKQLPRIRIPMMGAFSIIWTKYLNELQKDISAKVPTLEDSFKNMRPILDQSQRATETKIRGTLGRLAQKSSDITFDAVEYLSEGMEPAFDAARQITGTGSHKKRQGVIMAKVNKDVRPMCNEVLDRLAKGLAARKSEVPKELDLIAEEAICGVKQQMSFLVNNLVENCPIKSEDSSTKTELQNSIRKFVESWEDEWAQEGNYEEHILDKDLSIPDTIPEPVYEEPMDEEPADEEGGILDDDDLNMEM